MDSTEVYFKEIVAERARALGVIETAIPDAVLYCENALSAGETASVREILEARKADRPHWFQPSSGGGASGSTSTGGASKAATGKPISEMTRVEKVKLIGEIGYDAFAKRILLERK